MIDPAPSKPAQADKSHAQLATDWWRGMQRTTRKGEHNPASDPATLARLRRSTTIVDALAETATIRLCRQMGCNGHNHPLVERIAVLAVVLAHVGEDNTAPKTLGAALGAMREGGDMPLMSDLRLRQLLAARDAAEVLRGFRAAVALLGGVAPVMDLSRIVLDWLHPDQGDRIRTRFLFDYHGASDAAPPIADDIAPDAA